MSEETTRDESGAATGEVESLRALANLQASEIDRLRRDLHEAHRVLTRLAANQLGLGG